jgi:hypothetical protein
LTDSSSLRFGLAAFDRGFFRKRNFKTDASGSATRADWNCHSFRTVVIIGRLTPLRSPVDILPCMAGLDHSPPPPDEARDPVAERYVARLGLVLFALYLAAYGAFVFINAFRPAIMDQVPFAGINLAVASGLGLIVGALVLAVLYAWLCRKGGQA